MNTINIFKNNPQLAEMFKTHFSSEQMENMSEDLIQDIIEDMMQSVPTIKPFATNTTSSSNSLNSSLDSSEPNSDSKIILNNDSNRVTSNNEIYEQLSKYFDTSTNSNLNQNSDLLNLLNLNINQILNSDEQLQQRLHQDLIEENYNEANKNIVEMLLPTNLIYLKGKINNVPVKIIFDSGATVNCINKSKILEAGLDYLVDKSYKINMAGIQSNKKSYGMIWYTDIEFDLNYKEMGIVPATVGLNLIVIDDENIDKSVKDENIDKSVKDDDIENKNNVGFDIILGLTFMKSYKTNIDFSTNTITLNNSIKIKFD
jgi:hypothetical protein